MECINTQSFYLNNILNYQSKDLPFIDENNTNTFDTQNIPMNWMQFKEMYYYHFNQSKNKHVRKELILKYHQLISKRFPKMFRPSKRDEQRSIIKYFQSFHLLGNEILKAIELLEKENIINYEEDQKKLMSKMALKLDE